MSRVKAQSRVLPERSDGPPANRRSESITAIFDQIEFLFFTPGAELVRAIRVPEGVREDYGAGFRGPGCLNGRDIGIKSRSIDIDEYRSPPVLDDRVHGRRKSCRDCDHLVALFEGFEAKILQHGSAEAADRNQIRA